ncbi:MAG: hypothetical protein J5699_02230 [Bacteroidales bacterium]|nr:hypothetical protein [Bacteroidales bacterium]
MKTHGENENLYEVTAYTEDSLGLLYSISGIFARRSLDIEKLLCYPSAIEGVFKIKIYAWASPELIRQAVLQIEKKVDVIKAYYELDTQRSKKEVEEVKEILRKREEKENK